MLFPAVISKEPLGPVVRDDDPQWFDIVKWVVFATIAAEEKGVTSANVAAMRGVKIPRCGGCSGSTRAWARPWA